GATYLPLDPRGPAPRLREALRKSGCRGVLGTNALGQADWKGEPQDGEAVPWLGTVADLAAGPCSPPRAGSEPVDDLDGLAYIIFTSGSTGSPKGAMIEHRGMLNHIFAKIDCLGLNASDSVIQNAPQVFDISVWQFVAPLVAGGKVHIVGDMLSRDPAGLLN